MSGPTKLELEIALTKSVDKAFELERHLDLARGIARKVAAGWTLVPVTGVITGREIVSHHAWRDGDDLTVGIATNAEALEYCATFLTELLP